MKCLSKNLFNEYPYINIIMYAWISPSVGRTPIRLKNCVWFLSGIEILSATTSTLTAVMLLALRDIQFWIPYRQLQCSIVVVKWLALLPNIWGVPGQILGLEAGYHRIFRSFPQAFENKCWDHILKDIWQLNSHPCLFITYRQPLWRLHVS
jgi:hypothetical protein